jgi:hypothetical protein
MLCADMLCVTAPLRDRNTPAYCSRITINKVKFLENGHNEGSYHCVKMLYLISNVWQNEAFTNVKLEGKKFYKFGQRTQLDRAVRIGYGWKVDTDKRT